MSDSTTLQKQKSIVESEDPFERELQKRIRNKNKKLKDIKELEKKIKSKEIDPKEEQLEKIRAKAQHQADIEEFQAYLDLFKKSQKQTEQKERDMEKAFNKTLKETKKNVVTAIADILTIIAISQQDG